MSADVLVGDLTAFAAQSTIVALAAVLLASMLRIPPRARYQCLRLALVACLVMPWMLRMTEPTRPSGEVAAAVPATPAPIAAESSALVRAPVAEPSTPNEAPFAWQFTILTIVSIGIVCRALWLTAGFVRLRQLARRAIDVESAAYDAAQQRIGTAARIAHVTGLGQPATFGVRRPVVLLPVALIDASPELRMAVVTHELFHVRRRDWLSVLAEEAVRTALWFHPAILWLTSRIQLAREEVVDDLSVHQTGDRRAYMEALLSFAGSGGVLPAPAFARHRQLFHRIVSISKESVMSAPRVAALVAVLVATVSTLSWYGSVVFPIVVAAPVEPASSVVAPIDIARDEEFPPAPVPVALSTAMTVVPQKTGVQLQGGVSQAPQGVPAMAGPDNPIPAVRAVPPSWPSEFAGQAFSVAISASITLGPEGNVIDVTSVQCTVSETRDGGRREGEICRGFFDATAVAVRQWKYDRPVQAPLQFYVIVAFRPGSQPSIMHSAQSLPIDASPHFAGAALSAIYSNPPPVTQDSLRQRIAELDAVLEALSRARNGLPAGSDSSALDRGVLRLNAEISQERTRLEAMIKRTETAATVTVVPVPSSPFDGRPQLAAPSGNPVYRAGNNRIPSPRLVRQVPPSYTAEAMAARVEGMVIMEALVDEQGRVPSARVIRSIPLLDQAALDAAKQWEFTPTLLNGVPVPVLVQIQMRFDMRSTAGPR